VINKNKNAISGSINNRGFEKKKLILNDFLIKNLSK
jgi:hypothetical protein